MPAEWYLIASLRDHNKFCGGRNLQSNPVFESQTTQMIKKKITYKKQSFVSVSFIIRFLLQPLCRGFN